MTDKLFTLQRFPETLAVVRLGPGAEVPAWAESSSIFSITATATETSLLCAARSVPSKARALKPLTAFAVEGPLDFALTGVLSSLVAPLAAAEISIFAMSTFDTDWILVSVSDADRVADIWREQGHTVERAVPVDPGAAGREARSKDKRNPNKRAAPRNQSSRNERHQPSRVPGCRRGCRSEVNRRQRRRAGRQPGPAL